MFQIPTPEQWQKLFPLAEELLTTEPWRRFPEELIFRLNTKARKEPYYATVHGYEEDAIGVSVYDSEDDIRKYMNIIGHEGEITFQTIIANQSCVTVIFGEKAFLSPGDETAMKEGNYTPADEHHCVFFRKNRPGFAPWYIEQDDVLRLTHALTAFNRAATLFDAEVPDPEKAMIVFDESDGGDTVSVADFDPALIEEKEDIVKDDFYVARLKRLKRTGRAIEVDICYLNNAVGSQLGPIPFYPKLCVIADTDEGFIADQCIFEETSDEEEAFFELIAKYFSENGLPRKIKIRRENTGHLFHDLCKRLKITLEERDELYFIDDFLKMIGG